MLRLIFKGPVVEKIERERIGSRALIIENGKLLISLLGKRKQFLTPGGGLEKGETPTEAVLRECQEEAGVLVDAEKPFLVIDEYYGGKHWQNYYSVCSILEKVPTKYDEKEVTLDLAPVWVEEKQLKDIFSTEMTWEDCENDSFERTNAIKNSHYREYCAYLLSKGRDIPPIPENLKDTLMSVELEEITL